jgi:hypothetical protein
MECPGGGLDTTSTTNPDGSLSMAARCGQKFDPPAVGGGAGETVVSSAGAVSSVNCQNFSGNICINFAANGEGAHGVVGGGTSGATGAAGDGINSVGGITTSCSGSNCDVTYGGNTDKGYSGGGNGGGADGGDAGIAGGAGAGDITTVNCQNFSRGECIDYDNIETGPPVNNWGKLAEILLCSTQVQFG